MPVVLLESKRLTPTPAQKIEHFSELVCTNSLKSLKPESAHGLLKFEMESLGSLVISKGREFAVPAGDALAVNRDLFSKNITQTLESHQFIKVVDEVVENPLEAAKKWDCDLVVLATGPLTHPGLESWIKDEVCGDDLYFYDAIAPVVDADTLDISQMYFKDRWKDLTGEEEKDADHLNIPLNKDQYEAFVDALLGAEKVPPQGFEEYRFFESCLPIDLMAERGRETLRFSCMKPIGLMTIEGKVPHAVIQLRRENLLGEAFNLVGFQNRLKYGEQLKVFRTIPGMEKAEFIKLGSVHRNTFLNSGKVLNADLSSKKFPDVYFAGQITGVEGYTESASMGLYVGYQVLKKLQGEEFKPWPLETGIGALVNYIMTAEKPTPSNINFGLLPKVSLNGKKVKSRERKVLKKKLASERAQKVFSEFMKDDL